MTQGTPPVVSPSGLLKVQGSSKLAFGATTAALVTLASAGTAVLVQQATDTVATPTSLPPGALPLEEAEAPVVVDHPVGEQPAPDPTEKALRDALAQRREPGRRTLTVPLVPVDRVVTPAEPVVEPAPAVTPPAVTPPAVTPPAVTPPSPGSGHSVGKGPLGGGTGSGEEPAVPVPSAEESHHGKARGHATTHGEGQARGHDRESSSDRSRGSERTTHGKHLRRAHPKGRHAR